MPLPPRIHLEAGGDEEESMLAGAIGCIFSVEEGSRILELGTHTMLLYI